MNERKNAALELLRLGEVQVGDLPKTKTRTVSFFLQRRMTVAWPTVDRTWIRGYWFGAKQRDLSKNVEKLGASRTYREECQISVVRT